MELIAPLPPEVAQELLDHRDALDCPVAPTGEDVDLQAFPALRRLARMVLAQRLDQGMGFVVLRGLGALDLTPDQMQAAFWRFCVAMGEPMAQRADNVRFGRVADLGHPVSSRPRYHETAIGGSVHTDSPIMPQVADLVGLLCLRAAEQGGQSRFVSVARVHNILLRQAPDLLAEALLSRLISTAGLRLKDVSDDNPALLRRRSSPTPPIRALAGLGCAGSPNTSGKPSRFPAHRP
ncbi:TauD/TfdA family dioxygenase [Caulobacter segnis]